jgi:hypothetical protein
MDPQELLSLCKRRGFLWPAYDIYGSSAGLYDYGPLGAALKNNIENYWRKLFVLGEGHGWSSTSVQMDDAVPGSKSARLRTASSRLPLVLHVASDGLHKIWN